MENQNQLHKNSPEDNDACGVEDILYAPVEVGEPYEGPPIREESSPEFCWSGYAPPCVFGEDACLGVQKEQIKPGAVYERVESGTNRWLDMACLEALHSAQHGGGPFGAVMVQIDDTTGKVLRYWKNHNHVTEKKDPTAHAEVSVIRRACRDLGVFHLAAVEKKAALLPQEGDFSHCELYSSAEPCPMCYAAICWAHIPVLVFGATRFDAAAPGVSFSDAAIYEELALAYKDRRDFRLVLQGASPFGLDAFNYWKRSEKVEY